MNVRSIRPPLSEYTLCCPDRGGGGSRTPSSPGQGVPYTVLDGRVFYPCPGWQIPIQSWG